MLKETTSRWLAPGRSGGFGWLLVSLCLLSGGAVLASDPPAAV